MVDDMKLMIDDTLDVRNYYYYSQGLFNTDDQTKIGEEILLRSDMGSPEMIFKEAKLLNCLYELETKLLMKIVESTSRKNTPKNPLFFNIFPSTILHPSFPTFIIGLNIQYPSTIQHITFEIVETERTDNLSLLSERIKLMKSLGYFIAIDDVGKGYSSLNMIIELEPHFIKLDQYFSNNLSQSMLKQKMISSLLDYAQFSNSKVVLEGVEYDVDYLVAKELGIHICQGFLFEKPQRLSLSI